MSTPHAQLFPHWPRSVVPPQVAAGLAKIFLDAPYFDAHSGEQQRAAMEAVLATGGRSPAVVEVLTSALR
jgi:hypothetical protein